MVPVVVVRFQMFHGCGCWLLFVPVVVVTDVPEVFSAVEPYVTVWVVACWVVAGIVE